MHCHPTPAGGHHVKNKVTKFRNRQKGSSNGVWGKFTQLLGHSDPGQMSPHLLMMDDAPALTKLNNPGSKASCQSF